MKSTAMTMSFALIAIVHIAHIVAASVIRDSHGLEYASLNTQRNNLPLLVLPYGTWQASKYDVDSDVCGLNLYNTFSFRPNMATSDLHV
jgi:hypothetical protein